MVEINTKRIFGYLVIVVTVICSLWLVSIPTDTLLGYVGVENVYLFMFLVAFVGSLTTFASIPYPLILLGLAAGGVNPLFIGLASASGVITADSLTFAAVRRGRVLVNDKILGAIERLSTHIKKHPRLLTPGLLMYGTFSPLSNDFAVISLSLMKYKYLRVIPFLAIGNIFYNVGIAFLGVYAYEWIVNLI
jgi:hypothetical protein